MTNAGLLSDFSQKFCRSFNTGPGWRKALTRFFFPHGSPCTNFSSAVIAVQECFYGNYPTPRVLPPPPPPIPLSKQIMVHLLLCVRHAIAPRRKILREIAGNTAKCNVCTWLGSWLNSQKVPVSNPKHISSRNDETAKTESFPTFAAKCFCLGIDHALLQAQQSQESFVLLH